MTIDSNKKERLVYMDALKLFTISLVVAGHICFFMINPPGLGGVECLSHPVYLIIYSFHMPLFMTISGFFCKNITKGKGDIKKKARSLIVPCVTISLICLIFKQKDLTMWYLKSLFLCYVFYYAFYKYLKIRTNNSYIYLLLFCLLAFPFMARIEYFYKTDFMIPFFFLGLFLGNHEELIVNRNYAILFTFVFIVLLINWRVDYIWYASKPNWIPVKQLILYHNIYLDIDSLFKCTYRYLVGVLGSLSMISLFYQIGKSTFASSFFNKIGRYGSYSLHVYIIQSFLVELNIFNIHLHNMEWWLVNYVLLPILTIIFVLVSIIMAKLLEKNKIVNAILFGKL